MFQLYKLVYFNSSSASKRNSQKMNQRDLNCQRCSQVLKIHPSFASPNIASFQDLICERSAEFYNLESFQDLSQNDSKLESHETQTDTLAKLFDIFSDQSDIDHPLCQECANFILDQMDNQLIQLEQECRESRDFVTSQASASSNFPVNTKCDIDFLKSEIIRMELLEKDLTSQLKRVAEDQKETDLQISEIRKERVLMDEKNEIYWTEYNRLKHQLFNLDDELLSVENQVAYYKQRKEKLSLTNVLNATFHIWHIGHFATINGFRLGRLPKEPVSWDEINAAWGQCVLLLQCLAKKIGLRFKRFKLVPYGNNSFIESLDNKSRELPLYVSGGFMFIWTAKFDQAMIAFLDCLQQFKEQVEKDESSFKLPYKMEKGKIIDSINGYSFSIKMQTNSEEQWTKALKFMLTNLKWSLAYVASNHTYD